MPPAWKIPPTTVLTRVQEIEPNPPPPPPRRSRAIHPRLIGYVYMIFHNFCFWYKSNCKVSELNIHQMFRTHGLDIERDCGIAPDAYYNFLLYGSSILGAGLSFFIVIVSTCILFCQIRAQDKTYRLTSVRTVRPGTSCAGSNPAKNLTVPATGSGGRTSNVNPPIRGRTLSMATQKFNEQLIELRNLAVCIAVIFVVLCGTAQGLSIYSHLTG